MDKEKFRRLSMLPIIIGFMIESVGGYIYYESFFHQMHHIGLYICFFVFVTNPDLLCVSLISETLLFLDHSMHQTGAMRSAHLFLTLIIFISAVSEFYENRWMKVMLALQGTTMILLPFGFELIDEEMIVPWLITTTTIFFDIFHRRLDIVPEIPITVADYPEYDSNADVITFAEQVT